MCGYYGKCAVQTYDWGKVGRSSLVAELAECNDPDFRVDPEKPYAEFWMGTHPNGPSVIVGAGESLKDWIVKNPKSLGKAEQYFGNQLPFLFKVLAINKPLSIQVHPSKPLARSLHRKYPNVYMDANYKPEMAIALTIFETLCGFRLFSEIKKSFEEVPELRHVLGPEVINEFIENPSEDALRNCFNALLNAPKITIETEIQALLKRLPYLPRSAQYEQFHELIKTLQRFYPGDVGVFGPFFLNYIVLNKGEAVYIPENTPHCYISGDCVECMACSDNVIRAGLTSKPKDVATLLDVVDYRPMSPHGLVLKGDAIDLVSLQYKPPVPDFCVVYLTVSGLEDYSFGSLDYCAILLIFDGEGVLSDIPFKKGSVLYLISGNLYIITAKTDVVAFLAKPNI